MEHNQALILLKGIQSEIESSPGYVKTDEFLGLELLMQKLKKQR